jgi:hypothetical protein
MTHCSETLRGLNELTEIWSGRLQRRSSYPGGRVNLPPVQTGCVAQPGFYPEGTWPLAQRANAADT